mmetsp:Transcript_55752/g.103121  ORF Transcript_55752/g.103121 Transcript_55752/m.103121 type:complete len:136 (+) Transcript_55752:93-500(+)
MGGSSSAEAPQVAKTALRVAGEPLNKLGYPLVHEKLFITPQGKGTRQTICRCWLSKEFPRCDNTHQRLQKLGVNVGPAMFEVRPPIKAPVGSSSGGPGSYMENLSGSKAFALGGAAAASLAAVTTFGGVPPPPFL